MSKNKKWFVKVSLTLVSLFLLTAASFKWLDTQSEVYAQQVFQRSLVSYGLARSLNAVISVAQGTEIAIQPVGVGMTFTPGQVLDPLNDLVERFSWVVMASAGAMGLQKIFIKIFSWHIFNIIIGIILLLAMICLWKPGLFGYSVCTHIGRLCLIIFILRFSMPLFTYINDVIYTNFLQDQYDTSLVNLQVAQSVINNMEVAQMKSLNESDDSFVAKTESVISSAKGIFDIQAQLDELKMLADEMINAVMNVIVVFVFQTLLFPLLYLWLLLKSLVYISKIRFCYD